MSDWETIIGLEIHVQLNTKSKLFSKAPNSFGDEPNTNITAVCTGQPGVLPVLNKCAVKKAVQLGCALNSQVAHFSRFDRKSYFYPDSPRNYQITQFDCPIVVGGSITAEVEGEEKTFEIEHAHLEDDAGNSRHFSQFAGVDYNRAGVPLIEIVSKPCMHSAKDAAAYVSGIKAVMEYIDASDCNMEEGSLRVDVNISVRKKSEKGFRNKIEIKNMNSISNMELAIEAEIKRQVKIYSDNPDKDPKTLIAQSTFRWDPERKKTIHMRSKEQAEDYRYFPEPDLPPILLDEEYIEAIRAKLPELPYERKRRFVEELELPKKIAHILTQDKKLGDYFEEALKTTKNVRALSNWMIVEFLGRFKEEDLTLPDSEIRPLHMAKLVNLIDQNKITGKIAKSVADDMMKSMGKDPEEIVNENPDYQPLTDTTQLETLIDQVLTENEQSVKDFKEGRQKAFGYLVGQTMKLTKGTASPQLVNEILKKKLK